MGTSGTDSFELSNKGRHFVASETENSIKQKIMSEEIEILNAEFSVTPDKFLEIMWSDGEFWNSICEKQGIFDFQVGKYYNKAF